MTCWIPLGTATVENGCPWVLPGLHHYGTLAHRHDDKGLEIIGIGAHAAKGVAIPLDPGDIAVFSSLTPHKTGPNLTRHTRKALILQFIPDGAAIITRNGPQVQRDDRLNPLL